MTAAQRRKINRQNAQKSTGPKSAEGKAIARQNAIKHGLCAEKLALPHENQAAVDEQLLDWAEHYQPQGPDEQLLVEELARAALRLRRCAAQEAATLAQQVRQARQNWQEHQQTELDRLRDLLATEPARAVRALKLFGAGRRWLLLRWRFLAYLIERLHSWRLNDHIHEAIRLVGDDPSALTAGSGRGFLVYLHNTVAQPAEQPELLAWLHDPKRHHPDHRARYGQRLMTRDEARAWLVQLVQGEIAELEALEAAGQADESAEQRETPARVAVVPEGPDASLFLRYQTAAQSAFHRAHKALREAQADRAEIEAEAEMETETKAEAAARNEAKPPGEAAVTIPSEKTCGEKPTPEGVSVLTLPAQPREEVGATGAVVVPEGGAIVSKEAVMPAAALPG